MLDWYGLAASEGLAELIREIQWPNIRGGATLASLGDALKRRGVFTIAMDVPPGCAIKWPHPIILHNSTSATIGHFFVWTPGAAPDATYVYTAAGAETSQALLDRFIESGGAALLTSDKPIMSERGAFANELQIVRTVILLLSFGALLVVLWRCSPRASARCYHTRELPNE